jgi:outer membrane protein OmpA-like peptidoglycan-associated protein
VRWNSGNARVGSYTVTANVSDGKGGTASCSVDVRVEPRPNRAPSLTCSADRSTVITGERVRITGNGSDPDGETLNYTWRSNGGQIAGSGQNVTLDTSGLAPGRYRVTGRVEDPRGAAADCNVDVGVQAPPEKPQASKINECFFRAGSARVDNVCKRVLDDVAVRLQNDARARVVVIGYADPKEPRNAKLGQSRADETKKYLAGKGIAESRIDTRAAGGQAGADKQNRRIDVVFVPEGATY